MQQYTQVLNVTRATICYVLNGDITCSPHVGKQFTQTLRICDEHDTWFHPLINIDKMQGVFSISLQWGAWAGAGMAANDALLSRLRRQGYLALRPAVGLCALATALVGHANLPAVMAAGVFDWPLFFKGKPTCAASH